MRPPREALLLLGLLGRGALPGLLGLLLLGLPVPSLPPPPLLLLLLVLMLGLLGLLLFGLPAAAAAAAASDRLMYVVVTFPSGA
jgi:hypothetical protein